MERLYIYQEPFKGSILSMLTNGFVDYTGKEQRTKYIDQNGSEVTKIEFINPLTFEEYNKIKGGNLKTATDEEIETLLLNFQNQNILSNFEEISESKYFDLLECLPPKRWHHYNGLGIFFMGECFTANIYTCCIFDKANNKYFSALRRITEPSEEIEKTYLNS